MTDRLKDRGDAAIEMETVVIRDKAGNIIHKGSQVTLMPDDAEVTANGKDYYDTTVYPQDDQRSTEHTEE